jgi:penicillin-binding protein 1A
LKSESSSGPPKSRKSTRRVPALFTRRFWTERPRLRRGLLLVIVFGIAFGGGLAYASWALVCRGGACPSVAMLEEFTPPQTSKVYSVDGRFIAELGIERRTLVALEEIPSHVRQAFVITEDKRFYNHAGIDWIRVFGAAFRNVVKGSYAEGFSTLSMQLARNVFPEKLTREKTLTRKLREAKVARSIEATYRKDRILELYLNQIDLYGAYGVETAAQRYFGKSVRELNLAEAATLAAIPKAPAHYNPRRNPERSVQRRNTIIELMRRQGAITAEEARLASSYPLRLARKEEAGGLAPYFVEYVRQQLDRQFGQSLYRDGLQIYTTLDFEMQSAAERALEQQIRAIEEGKFGAYRQPTYEEYMARAAEGERESGNNSPYLQGALISLDPRTGAIRALVGGRDFEDSKFNRATQALRQPGSTFKPVVYADAIRQGRAPAYILHDVPVSVPQVDGSQWTPQNYDRRFEGGMSMRRALYQSRNIPAVRMGMELGEQSVVDMSRRLGITTPIPAYPSIHLGAADVYPLELVAAYTPFATLGTRTVPSAIVRVENARGEVLWEATPQRFDVMSPEEAWLVTDMLRDVVRRGTAFAPVWNAGFRHPAAGKTGTTNDGTDVWFIGYTSDLVTGVWLGFDRPKRIMPNAQGGRLAAPAWTAFMTEVYRSRSAPSDWPRPDRIVVREVDAATGMARSAYCPADRVVTEYFIAGTEPFRECYMESPFDLGGDEDGATGERRARTDTVRVTIPDPFRLP